MPANWSSFWKKQNDAFNRVMEVATGFFYKQLIKRHPLRSGDAVLDYGCGPGLLINNLLASGVDVTGADINEYFLQQNRTKFPGVEFIHLSGAPEVTFTRQFDCIILLSIAQYFNSLNDVESVVRSLKRCLKPGGKIIIADVLDEHTSSAKDAIGIFTQCISRGRVIAFAKFILYLIMSDYRQTSRNNQLLLLSPEFVKQMAERNGLVVEEAKGMTPHPTRSNYILRCK